MYKEKKKAGLIPSKQNQGYKQDNRGRSSTPGRSNEPHSSSNLSHKSGGSQTCISSANSDKKAARTEVSVDIWHESNFSHLHSLHTSTTTVQRAFSGIGKHVNAQPPFWHFKASGRNLCK